MFTRLPFEPAPYGSPAAVFFFGTSVPAFGDADGEVKLIPSFIIGLRPCFAIPASASSGLGIELFAMVFLTVVRSLNARIYQFTLIVKTIAEICPSLESTVVNPGRQLKSKPLGAT
jgi:hypothetical protein